MQLPLLLLRPLWPPVFTHQVLSPCRLLQAYRRLLVLLLLLLPFAGAGIRFCWLLLRVGVPV
jgi:hypothetical protein